MFEDRNIVDKWYDSVLRHHVLPCSYQRQTIPQFDTLRGLLLDCWLVKHSYLNAMIDEILIIVTHNLKLYINLIIVSIHFLFLLIFY